MIITIIGRGHSGTRAIAKTLLESGVYIGSTLNAAYDLIPGDKMYEAAVILGEYVYYRGNYEWDFSKLHIMPIPSEFQACVYSYLSSILENNVTYKGWKLPETTLAYPWIRRMFPEVYYIHWIRDPRDCILQPHLTDDIGLFNVPNEYTNSQKLTIINENTLLNTLQNNNAHRSESEIRMLRATSWKYHIEIVQQTPLPKNFITIRFEDFVLNQDQTLKKLENFLGIKLKKIEVNKEAVGRWRKDSGLHDFDFLKEDLKKWGYEE